ncbi:MAG TPA: 3-hydroxyacyl-CoA dehydrogenase NAD-binding domain-containing protein [Caldimonas sp.]|nr:3-hydroxyacyl-CoA dehydrogenase NAD-binding domain-containing protein [Caldimonas sp.]HEV7577891.1 3-hydroxyacyl-CoA dehydrogenase NAD-binding domain-containing protein [Caldimonas sp.]
METLRYELADGIVTITFDAPDSSVNTMTLAWQRDFAAAAAQARADKEKIRGIVLASAKSTFFAGAALKNLLTLEAKDAASGFAEIEAMKASFRTLETLGRPVVALLAGSALGGGWEVALIGHARFAVDDASIRFGTPEVSLGLIPGATGITKTVRKLGLMAAQPYLLEGKLFGPREAEALGWIDGLADSADALRAMAIEWIGANPDATQPWDRRDYRMPGGTPASPKIAAAIAVAPAVLAQKTRGLYPAAQAILEAMVEGALVDYDTATRIESRKLAKVMVGQTARNMIQAFFFDLNAIKSGKARPKGFAPWRPAKVGVLGAGMMGAGIAHANAARGIACVLKDVSTEKAAAGLAAIRKVTAGQVKRGALDEAGEAKLLALVTPAADARALDGCDLIVEAVFENRALKGEVTREAEPMLAADGVFASNTSTLPITGLAAASRRPERFVGLHFFSPVHKMKLVEIIRGKQTSDETIARAYDYVIALGKTPIVVNDARGFFTSRVFGTYVMEGAAMLAEGIAAPLVEHAALAAGMPVGPLAVLDETSLALSVHVLEQTRADWQAEGRAYVPSAGEALVEKMVKTLGRPGRAGGGGFYDYPAGAPKRLWPGLATNFAKAGAAADIGALKQRLLYRQSIETARCLAEGVLTSVAEANIGSIFGIGFPAWTGGAIQFIAAEGRATFLANAAALAGRHGDRFAIPAATLDTALATDIVS